MTVEWTDGRISDRFGDHERRICHNEDVLDALSRLPESMAEMRSEVRDAARAAADAADRCRRETEQLKARLDERDKEREEEKKARADEKAQAKKEKKQDRRAIIAGATVILAAIIGAAGAIIASGGHP